MIFSLASELWMMNQPAENSTACPIVSFSLGSQSYFARRIPFLGKSPSTPAQKRCHLPSQATRIGEGSTVPHLAGKKTVKTRVSRFAVLAPAGLAS